MSNRAFRISFDEKVSKFVIEIQGFMGLSWKPAMKPEVDGLGHPSKGKAVNHFDTYKQARDAVTEMGLDQIYDDFTQSKPWVPPVSNPQYPQFQTNRGM